MAKLTQRSLTAHSLFYFFITELKSAPDFSSQLETIAVLPAVKRLMFIQSCPMGKVH